TLALSPLADGEVARLIDGLLGERRLDDETKTQLIARASGNPLFAEQFARMLEDGAIDEVPDSVQAVIAARLDLLDPDDKALVQDAAVVGEIFWPGALANLGGRDPQAVAQQLHMLARNEFVERRRRSS